MCSKLCLLAKHTATNLSSNAEPCVFYRLFYKRHDNPYMANTFSTGRVRLDVVRGRENVAAVLPEQRPEPLRFRGHLRGPGRGPLGQTKYRLSCRRCRF